jgi:uncharacterized protein (DUF433 family)
MERFLTPEIDDMKKNSPPKLQVFGRYVIADPRVCHGQPTFRGTRIMVSQVLEQVALGVAWESISERWDGKVTREAIAEAVRLANQAFLEHAQEYVAEPTPT